MTPSQGAHSRSTYHMGISYEVPVLRSSEYSYQIYCCRRRGRNMCTKHDTAVLRTTAAVRKYYYGCEVVNHNGRFCTKIPPSYIHSVLRICLNIPFRYERGLFMSCARCDQKLCRTCTAYRLFLFFLQTYNLKFLTSLELSRALVIENWDPPRQSAHHAVCETSISVS